MNSSDGGREIDDPQLLLSMLIGKTITDIIMYGNIPAKDKLLEVEMVFAENRLELGTTAKEFVLDMANHGEAWKLVSQMMTPQGTSRQCSGRLRRLCPSRATARMSLII